MKIPESENKNLMVELEVVVPLPKRVMVAKEEEF